MRPGVKAPQGVLYLKKCTCNPSVLVFPIRTIHNSSSRRQDLQTGSTTSPPPPPPSNLPDPTTAHTRDEEAALLAAGVRPVGSRRRRAALASSANIPFEKLPYQCFQEARKIIAADRDEKLKQIETQRARIERVKQQNVVQEMDTEAQRREKERLKAMRLKDMRKVLERLKILADVNDPVVKRKFEDGMGDLNKPIYRYYAEKKWRSYRHKILEQRITQMNVVPDILPSMQISADASMSFGRTGVNPGALVPSSLSEKAPQLKVQVFDRGERLVSIAVVDADVPNLETDGFDYRLHYLACNIPISPTSGTIKLAELDQGQQLVSDWLPPHSQKGAPYHRLAVFVLQQEPGQTVEIEQAKEKLGGKRLEFKLRAFVDRHKLNPITVFLFRTQWDDSMEAVMKRNGFEGWDMQFKLKKVEPMPYRRKPKDFEKYR